MGAADPPEAGKFERFNAGSRCEVFFLLAWDDPGALAQ